jgi:hypothetical protein
MSNLNTENWITNYFSTLKANARKETLKKIFGVIIYTS